MSQNGDHSHFGETISSSTYDGNPFGEEDALEQKRRKSEADSLLEKHVTEQLKRAETNESAAVYEDEFEAQLN